MKNLNIYEIRRLQIAGTYSRTMFIIHSGIEAKRSHSVKYRFKPASDFHYLCGLHLSGALLVILGKKTYLLFDTPDDQVWGEDTVLTEQDKRNSEGFVFEPLHRLEEIIRSHINQFDKLAVSLDRDKATEDLILNVLSYDRKLRGRIGSPVAVCDSRTLIGTIRHIKSEDEILHLREAGARTSKVHTRLMQQKLVGRTERQISNWIEAGFLLEDLQWTAYETIVGSGSRSTLLHARATDRMIQDGEIVLIDAGGEWNGYCSDITRVLPAGKAFSPRQKEIYNIALAAQKSAITAVRPGQSLQEIHNLTVDVLKDGLLRLKFSKDLIDQNIGKLMPHTTSHWMGLDVHDPSPYLNDDGSFIKLEMDMSFTIEPGLYFRDHEVFEEYFGIGVRIEDDVIVTESGCELLSAVPKEIEEIEELRSRVK